MHLRQDALEAMELTGLQDPERARHACSGRGRSAGHRHLPAVRGTAQDVGPSSLPLLEASRVCVCCGGGGLDFKNYRNLHLKMFFSVLFVSLTHFLSILPICVAPAFYL